MRDREINRQIRRQRNTNRQIEAERLGERVKIFTVCLDLVLMNKNKFSYWWAKTGLMTDYCN